jgi:hypothetical protein
MNVMNNRSLTSDKGWSFSLGLDGGLTVPHRKTACYEMLHRAADLDSLRIPKQLEMDTRLGAGNDRSLCRTVL